MKLRIIALLLGFLFIAPIGAFALPVRQACPTLTVFHSPACHACIKVKNEIMPVIEKKFSGRLIIEYRDINDIENYKYMLALKEKYKPSIKSDIPVFYLGGHFVNAGEKTAQELEKFIVQSLRFPVRQQEPLPFIDLVERFKGFRPLMVVGAGLIDGINPCAFTVIVFFISFLALQGYRRRELEVIGSFFIFAVFLTYLLIGVGLFRLFFAMRGFVSFVKLFNLCVGFFSIVLGNLALYDYFKYKKTRESEGLLLQLPAAVKHQIHKVIGLHYRKKSQGATGEKRPVFALAASALATGFLVSILEAICTGQTYLPTIAFVLKTTPLKLQAFMYLVLYNIMFVVPLIIIFIFALLGTTSSQFTLVLQKHMLKVKLLMAVLFLSLGIYLVWRG